MTWPSKAKIPAPTMEPMPIATTLIKLISFFETFSVILFSVVTYSGAKPYLVIFRVFRLPPAFLLTSRRVCSPEISAVISAAGFPHHGCLKYSAFVWNKYNGNSAQSNEDCCKNNGIVLFQDMQLQNPDLKSHNLD